jgi:hypothetical protein
LTLDAYMANKVVAALAGGAGVAELVSLLLASGGISAPAALITGIAAAMLVIGAATIQFCTNSRGVKIYRPYIGAFHCTGG